MSAIDRESICEKYLNLTFFENFEAKWLDDDDDQNLTNAKEVGNGEVDAFRKELKKLFVEQFGNCFGMGSSSKGLLQDSNM